MKTDAKLNLTRKWRSKTFDTIVGQDVSVRILKNSLFLDQIFPVYLFSGQRGCGKTSTARVFTAAVNCAGLDSFRKDPKNNLVPCLTCSSCIAMEQGKHPDFTEIDAASHTGVDNIRQLIETTSFLPIMGRKKVYLIDEVHMLSKAAFNALLKILEEPPLSVIFILATTDPHKVIDTVKSRCFQLFFGPPQAELLLKHLEKVCQAENIKADSAALAILIRESEGSIRDAMNLLEQVRFIETHVTVNTVARALGYIDDTKLINLLDLTLSCDSSLPRFLADIDFSTKNVDFIWRRLCELLKNIIYLKHGVGLTTDANLNLALEQIAHKFYLESLLVFLDSILAQEYILLKTAHKSLALELFFLQHAASSKITEQHLGSNLTPKQVKKNQADLTQDKDILTKFSESVIASVSDSDLSNVVPASLIGLAKPVISQDSWQQLLGLLSGSSDPMLTSLFKQAQFAGIDSHKNVQVNFSVQNLFFKDLIWEKENFWAPYVKQIFGEQASLQLNFIETDQESEDKIRRFSQVAPKNVNNLSKHLDSNNLSSNLMDKKMAGRPVDVSDVEKWPLASQILTHFPGQVYEVGE